MIIIGRRSLTICTIGTNGALAPQSISIPCANCISLTLESRSRMVPLIQSIQSEKKPVDRYTISKLHTLTLEHHAETICRFVPSVLVVPMEKELAD